MEVESTANPLYKEEIEKGRKETRAEMEK